MLPTSPPQRLLVPLYEHPADRPEAWRRLIEAAPGLYGVVLNPCNGPGQAPDPAFAEVAGALRAAGVRRLGYADTAYGRRPHAEVVQDLLRHRDWYATDGAFFDQAAPGPEFLPHYGRLAVAARAVGATTVVLNHGLHPHPRYLDVADLLVTFEDDWAAYESADVPPWTAGHPPERFCHLIHGVPDGCARAAAELSRRRGAAVHCAVPGTHPHPWDALPSCLETYR
ncbi:spherulation-specific family 4 protein [Streptomyces sp. MST-110588]|uniref:spherulation-specific family 4 protein n=1 Tax=Streptomyces sp. MST-110588 TaxID=2833628 RepID=UPI001F5D6B5E|nr:spherulation-specific family 4 protein [Streptomyces sp. MST-110588]UNO42498.1 spherulation-specific family 4 protein [Streptomyces sp. MST-110588]